jgi:hypothetical protein
MLNASPPRMAYPPQGRSMMLLPFSDENSGHSGIRVRRTFFYVLQELAATLLGQA